MGKVERRKFCGELGQDKELFQERHALCGVRFQANAIRFEIDRSVLEGDPDLFLCRAIVQNKCPVGAELLPQCEIERSVERKITRRVRDAEADRVPREDLRNRGQIGNNRDVFRLFLLGQRRDGGVGIGKRRADLHFAERKIGLYAAQRDGAVLRNEEGEANRDLQIEKREHGDEFGASAVFGERKRPAAELRKQGVGVKRNFPCAVPFRSTQELCQFRNGKADAYPVPVSEVDGVVRIVQGKRAELRAQIEMCRVGGIHRDRSRKGRSVQREVERKIDRPAENGTERLGKAVDRRQFFVLGRSRGRPIGIVLVVVLICRRLRTLRPVFIVGVIVRRTLCIYALGGGVCLFNVRRKHLPRRVERVCDRDILKDGQ